MDMTTNDNLQPQPMKLYALLLEIRQNVDSDCQAMIDEAITEAAQNESVMADIGKLQEKKTKLEAEVAALCKQVTAPNDEARALRSERLPQPPAKANDKESDLTKACKESKPAAVLTETKEAFAAMTITERCRFTSAGGKVS